MTVCGFSDDRRDGGRQLSSWRWAVLLGATLVGLCVYYLNYGISFDEGGIQDGSVLTVLARFVVVGSIVWVLQPFRLRLGLSELFSLLFLICGLSFFSSAGVSGQLNDSLFINTLIQVPILMALTLTTWHINFDRWVRFIGVVIAMQVLGDVFVALSGGRLWQSGAFIGGLGNPSSFGLYCSVVFAFFLFHPRAGRGRWILAIIVAFGALMSKALLAVLAVLLILTAWMFCSWRRSILALIAIAIAAIGVTILQGDVIFEELRFVVHKLNAVGALVGIVEYEIATSSSVSLRLQIHEETWAAIADEPSGLLFGHLQNKAYWPMDSQLLTYVGSFGALVLASFVLLHLTWLQRAVRSRRIDGGTGALSLATFGCVFVTNRILDYFPVAMLYFLIVAMVIANGRIASVHTIAKCS